MTEVAPNVFCFQGTEVNVAVIRDGDALTLIDGGWPGDVAAIEAAIRSIGSHPEAISAILLTHAHIDHVGAVAAFHNRFGTPVYARPTEAKHAAREFVEQATEDDVLKGPMPQTLHWWEKVKPKIGSDETLAVPEVRGVEGGPLDAPGRPELVSTPGHTSGHSAYLLPDTGVIVTGDGLITAHGCSTLNGPQPCPWFFNHDIPSAMTSLDSLRDLDAGIILPGHGAPLEMPISEAVDLALAAAERPEFTSR